MYICCCQKTFEWMRMNTKDSEIYNKMKKKKYHPYGTVPKSNWKITESDAKLIPLIHRYMTADFTGLVQALQWIMAGLN